MMRPTTLGLLAPLLLAFIKPASATRVFRSPVPVEWQSTQLKDHPLVGVIWSARDGRPVTAADLGAVLARGRFVLLGEVHDNPDHHRLQAFGVGAASRRFADDAAFSAMTPPLKTFLALEMVSEDRKSRIDAFNAKAWLERTPEDLARAADWEKSGWPPFEIYAPLIREALAFELNIFPASPSRERTRAVSKEGFAALGEAEAARLALDRGLDPPLAAALEAELVEGHCGLLPADAAGRMAPVQRFRDAAMADALLGGDPGRTIPGGAGAILIAGNGHVRRDRGAPYYLERRGVTPDEILSVMHVEVEKGKTDPAAYVPRGPDGTPAADYLWFTPRRDRPDPCEAMRRHLEKPKR